MTTGDDLKRDDRIGKWVIRERIGAGGMGTVYRAVDSHLHREVALKTLVPERVAELYDIPAEEVLDRFRREAQAVARVKHPNVLEIISYEVVDGRSIIEMELLVGETLGKFLRKGAVDVGRALEIILPVCAAVAACHERGIIHRDLKPGNIFLAEREGRRAGDRRKVEVVKVLDFGVSKIALANELTQVRRLLGTPNYMAPEQVRGQADERSDQYAIGVLLYHCLTGRPPYAALRDKDQVVLLAAVQTGDFPRPRELRPELPEALEAIILRAMSVDAAARFGSVDELGRRLVPFAAAEVAQQWSEYFLESTPQLLMEPGTSLPNSLIGGGGSTIKDLVEVPDRSNTSGATRTLNERDIATATDVRFTATTAVTPPVPPEATTGAAAGPPPDRVVDEPDSKIEAAGQTPWSVADAGPASKTQLLGARRRMVQGSIVVTALALGAGALWLSSARTPSPRPPASATSSAPATTVRQPENATDRAHVVVRAQPDAAPVPETSAGIPDPRHDAVGTAHEPPEPPRRERSSKPQRRRLRPRTDTKPLGPEKRPETAPDGVIVLPP